MPENEAPGVRPAGVVGATFAFGGSPLVALGLLTIVTLLAYGQGLRGDFMFDDFPNIVDNPKVQIQSLGWDQLVQAWHSGVVGVNGRALAMLSFGINHAITGPNPAAFKFVNLLLHLLGGVLVFHLTRYVITIADARPSNGIALWATGAWLLHPINLTPVLLVVQRMTEISALFTLTGLLLYLRLRTDAPTSLFAKRAAWACVPVLWYLGFLGKETAILAPLFALAFEFYLLNGATSAARLTPPVYRLLIGAGVLACVLAALTVTLRSWVFAPESLVGRDFTPIERLLTEARVMWIYVKSILLPVLSDFNLFHDGLQISRGLLSPWTTLVAVLAWLILAGLLLTIGRRAPIVGLGVAWFCIGHLLESTIIPLELMFEHRNYLPSYGLFLAAGDLFRRRFPMATTRVSIAVATVVLAILAAQTAARAHAFGSPVRLYTFEVEHNPTSSRAQLALALALHEENLTQLAADRALREQIHWYLARSAELDPEITYPFLAKIYLSCAHGDPIDPSWSHALLLRWQTSKVWGDRVRTITQFANAAIGQKLCLDTATIRSHFDTFLGNPHAAPQHRAHVLLRYGEYMNTVIHDRPAALAAARQALAISQAPSVKQEYARILHLLGETDEAQRTLKSIPPEQRAF